MKIRTLEWKKDCLVIIDQTQLPLKQIYLELKDHYEVALAIKEMKIRGAPAIGVSSAYGIALAALKMQAKTIKDFEEKMEAVYILFSLTRPTAVNLFHTIERMKKVGARLKNTIEEAKAALEEEARKIEKEEDEANHLIGKYGVELIEDGFTILTHCNAGALATVDYGTALGVVRAAKEKGFKIQVYATETRPLFQGARLTAWELMKEGIPVTLITDDMAGHFMSKGSVDCIIVGADRIAANGDVANKIGTYSIAVLAKENGVPFYVAAPISTIDLSIASGEEIKIEERKAEEITEIGGKRIAPEGVKVANPAFDITPHVYVSAIITEKGVVREPYDVKIKELLGKQ